MGVVQAGAQKAKQGKKHMTKLCNSPGFLQNHGLILPPAAGTAATDHPVLYCPGLGHLLAVPVCKGFRPLVHACTPPPGASACPGHVSYHLLAQAGGFLAPHSPFSTFPTVAPCCHSAVGTAASIAQACSGRQLVPRAPLRPCYSPRPASRGAADTAVLGPVPPRLDRDRDRDRDRG